ncbi:class I SAM-dependent methyltransferase [Mesorhizobium yinganensis]|uniref:class I SAM-dependent methyltransferase n=1 Tax=Mesorhizobium yinganensis TaxID=3157707 RepID=UPI0032B8423C
MSRLESFIRRMTAQRLVLDAISAEVAAMQGPIMELGLGNGRTYDHLRERLPGRRIIAFDRALGAHPSSVPPEGDLVIGEIRDTAAHFAGIGAALVHADIGTGIDEIDLRTQQWLPGLAASLLQPGGLAVSGLPLDHAALQPLPLCDGVPADRYFIYRKAA